MKVKLLSRVRLLATPWTVAYQAPPSMGFSRQEYWSGVPLPSPLRRPSSFLSFSSEFMSVLSLSMLQWCPILCVAHQSGFSAHGDSPGKNTGEGSHTLLQGIYIIQGSNPCLMSPALAGGFFTTSVTWEARVNSSIDTTTSTSRIPSCQCYLSQCLLL